MPLAQLRKKEAPLIDVDRDRERIVRQFLKSLKAAAHHTWPYDYRVLEDALPDSTVGDIAALPFIVQTKKDFSYGTRESNNGSRIYFTPQNQGQIDVCYATAEAFKDARVLDLIEKVSGKNVSDGRLRIEYCQDTDGFWLEPHVDISAKLFSMLIYLSDDPVLHDAGTNVYDSSPEHNIAATIPYKRNRAMFFIPGRNTWHGFSKRPIHGIRKSLIINYVWPDWRDKWELA